MSAASWDDLYEQFEACKLIAETARDPSEARQRVYECQVPIVAQAARQAASLQQEDLDWFRDALREEGWKKKYLVTAVFYQVPLDRRLFRPMLGAAVYEVNPSDNRVFVEPCMMAFGMRVVNEALLDWIETGNDFEKAGAVNAMYWAQFRVSTDFGLENATPESTGAAEEFSDLKKRKRCLFLKTFVENENVELRRSVIASLELDESIYPSEYKPLVSKAIRIARDHSDEYIRRRLQVQLGAASTFPSLPHRNTKRPKSEGQGP